MKQTKYYTTDRELFQISKKELYTAVIGDIMDEMGFLNQFLPPDIKPLREDMFMIGRAMTVLESDYTEEERKAIVDGKSSISPALMLKALDELQEHEIYICTGSSPDYALWGELMSARAHRLGAGGVVLNGYTRDKKNTVDGSLPIFSMGSFAQDQSVRGRVVDFKVNIRIGKVDIKPGDILVGDMDGACVVPREIEEEVFTKAIEKARAEKTVKYDLENGMTAAEAFAKYGLF